MDHGHLQIPVKHSLKSDKPISVQVPSIFIPKHTIKTYPYRHKRFHTYYDFPEQGISR